MIAFFQAFAHSYRFAKLRLLDKALQKQTRKRIKIKEKAKRLQRKYEALHDKMSSTKEGAFKVEPTK